MQHAVVTHEGHHRLGELGVAGDVHWRAAVEHGQRFAVIGREGRVEGQRSRRKVGREMGQEVVGWLGETGQGLYP